jgi:hypothetical protein
MVSVSYPPPDLVAVAALRARLWEAGYRPIPVYHPAVGGASPGKRPAGKNWGASARHDPPDGAVNPPHADTSNTGVLCDSLRVVDIDVDDADAAMCCRELAVEMLGETTVRTRRDTCRSLLPYRAAEGAPPKARLVGRLGQIEVLGAGQQFVAFGRHATGRNLEWSTPLDQVPLADLPAVTEEQIAVFLVACAEVLGAPSGKPNGGANFFDPGPEIADEDALLTAIRDGQGSYDATVRLAGVYAARGIPEADAVALILDAYAERPQALRDDAYSVRLTEVPGIVASIYAKESKKRPGASRTHATPEPDLSVLRLNRRAPPDLPVDVFGPWQTWLPEAAKAAAAPTDYIASTLLAVASALIGNARWPILGNWSEPPHLWCASVGDSGDGKSPAADILLRDVTPTIEMRMARDFPDQHRDWQTRVRVAEERKASWQEDVRKALRKAKAASEAGGSGGDDAKPPLPPTDIAVPDEPMMPVLTMMDVTHERVAQLLATSAPKGVLMHRDELSGWLLGMSVYSDAARPFWLEAYGGRRYRVDRVKSNVPIIIPHLAVSWHGGIQPEKLVGVLQGADDGLLSRFAWFWPNAVPFHLTEATPDATQVTERLDRLRLLELTAGFTSDDPSRPFLVPLDAATHPLMEAFGREMRSSGSNSPAVWCAPPTARPAVWCCGCHSCSRFYGGRATTPRWTGRRPPSRKQHSTARDHRALAGIS